MEIQGEYLLRRLNLDGEREIWEENVRTIGEKGGKMGEGLEREIS